MSASAIQPVAEVLEGCLGTRAPWQAGDNPLVHGLSEPVRSIARPVADPGPLGFHQLTEPVPPGAVVRRVDQHPVHVEDGSL
jgi:hypothetical protein